MSLPATYVAALAIHCAPLAAPETLVSIAQAESGLEPLAIHNNTTGETLLPPTVDAAIREAEDLIRAGHSVDLGLMQINSANLPLVNLTVVQAFEACHALAAGARLLAAGYSGGSTTNEQQRALRIALSRYNTGDPTDGFANGYVSRVESAARQVVPAIQVPGSLPEIRETQRSTIHEPDGWADSTVGEWHLSETSASSAAGGDGADGWHRRNDARPLRSIVTTMQPIAPVVTVESYPGDAK
jgi:hypothetical protein